MLNLEKIKQNFDIVNEFKKYNIELRPIDDNEYKYKGICPLHSGTAHNLFVYPELQSWYCFTCEKGGDIFRLIEVIEKCSFLDAIKLLTIRSYNKTENEAVFLKDVRKKFDIVEELKKNYNHIVKLQLIDRKNYRGFCPIHGGLNRRMVVYPRTQSWYCHYCKRGGDIFDFVQIVEKCNLAEAIDKLLSKSVIQEKETK